MTALATVGEYPYVLDSVLISAMEMRQKHQDLTLIIKQVTMLAVRASISAQELHQKITAVIEQQCQLRRKQTLPIIMIHAQTTDENIIIRFICSPILQSKQCVLSNTHHTYGKFQAVTEPVSQVKLVIPQYSIDSRNHV